MRKKQKKGLKPPLSQHHAPVKTNDSPIPTSSNTFTPLKFSNTPIEGRSHAHVVLSGSSSCVAIFIVLTASLMLVLRQNLIHDGIQPSDDLSKHYQGDADHYQHLNHESSQLQLQDQPQKHPQSTSSSAQQETIEQQQQTTKSSQSSLPNNQPPLQFKSMWHLISHHSQTYNIPALQSRLKQMFHHGQRAFNPALRKFPLLPAYEGRGAGYSGTTRHKLLHDLEQFDYFMKSAGNGNVGMNSNGLKLFGETLPRVYGETLQRLDEKAALKEFDEHTEFYKFQKQDKEFLEYYNRALFLAEFPKLEGPYLTERNWGFVEHQWFGEADTTSETSFSNHPGIIVIDNLLTPQTLQRLRDYLLLSTFWFEAKTPHYKMRVIFSGDFVDRGENSIDSASNV